MAPRLPKLPRIRASATRQDTGTSYTAQGTQPANYSEIGSQAGTRLIDPLPALSNPRQAAQTYRKMVRADASVRTSLRAGKAPVLGAEFFVEPFSDDPQDLAIQEFVEFNLFNGMTTPWLKTLEQILKFYEDGYQVFEPVWELREWAPRKTSPAANRRKYTMLRKLAVRPTLTILRIEYDDNGGPTGIVQNALDANGKVNQVTIPIDKLIIFTFDQDGGDLTGNSILRSAYQHWYYKDHLYKIDAIQKERHGIGVPDIVLNPGFSPQDKDFAHELGRNLRTNQNAYIVRTTLMTVGFAELSGNPVDVLASALHHDVMIMKNVMVQFLNAGLDASGGGRATSATAMDMFLKAMRYVAQGLICDPINLYLIPNLVAYNFKTDRFPQLRARNIGEAKDLQMWAAAVRNLVECGALLVDDVTEQWIRQQVDMPRRTTEFVPPEERPTRIQETILEQGQLDRGNGNQGSPSVVRTGNTGVSPSSGA